MDKFKIVGGDDIQKETAEKQLENYHEQGPQPRYGEDKKRPGDIKLIGIANDLLAQLSQELNFPFKPIPAERIHIAPTAAGKRMGKYGSDHRDISVSEINIRKTVEETSVNENMLRLAVITHEAVHFAGHHKYQVTQNGKLASYRIGYSIDSRDGISGTILDGFNEAVVDAITMTLLRRNAPLLEEEFGTSSQSENESILYNYMLYAKMLAMIVTKIAEVKSQSVEEVRDRIFRGHFTGEMMHLRDIEKAYGKNALQIFSLWGDNHQDDDIIEQIIDYLQETSLEKREAIANKLLTNNIK